MGDGSFLPHFGQNERRFLKETSTAANLLSTLSPSLTFETKSAAASQISAIAKVKRIRSIDDPPVVFAFSTALPYILLTEDVSSFQLSLPALGLLLFVGIIHTGIAYTLYFGSLNNLKAQTAAIFSYIDPIVAIILSALLLREHMGWTGVVGAILILGSALVSELPEKAK